ncbi:hypothetical protein [Novosphingobium sp.]
MALRTIRDLALTIAALVFAAQTIATSYDTGLLGDLVWMAARKA